MKVLTDFFSEKTDIDERKAQMEGVPAATNGLHAFKQQHS